MARGYKLKDRPEYRTKPDPVTCKKNELVFTAAKLMTEKNYGAKHDMLLRLNHQNLCFFALLASIISTLVISLTTEMYNNDAYSYIRAAELITESGLQAEIKNFTWLGYSTKSRATAVPDRLG